MEKNVPQQQGKITDNLASVIQIIRVESGTGELRAMRGEGIESERGSIKFVNGQIVYAQVGPYQGPTAFNILNTWGRCVFFFFAVNMQHSGSLPALLPEPPQQHSPRDTTSVGILPFTGGQTPLPIPQEHQPELPPATTIPSTAIPRATMSAVKAVALIEKAELPRTYRQIFLLINGRRSVHDLIIRAGCAPEDMYRVLETFEKLAVIRIIQ